MGFALIGTNATVVPIGTGTMVIGGLCFVNSVHTSVHLVADHLGAIVGSAYTPAAASGAPVRVVDTWVGSGWFDRRAVWSGVLRGGGVAG